MRVPSLPLLEASDGLERLRRLVDGYLRYVEVDTFPGGCFFASVLAEMDTHPGPVRDGLVDFIANNLEAIALLIVLVSVLPMVVEYLRSRGKRRDSRYDEPHERQAVLDDDVRG